MKLRDLEARLLRVAHEPSERLGTHFTFLPCERVEQAQGVDFLCPACFAKNGGSIGTHHVRVWFDGCGVDPAFRPEPRWRASGTTLDDLSVEPSIAINTSLPPQVDERFVCRWHGWVKNGDAS